LTERVQLFKKISYFKKKLIYNGLIRNKIQDDQESSRRTSGQALAPMEQRPDPIRGGWHFTWILVNYAQIQTGEEI
jgi:hypothetical protein